MSQPFTIVKRQRQGVTFYQVTDHRNHVDYRCDTKREATEIAKRIEQQGRS